MTSKTKTIETTHDFYANADFSAYAGQWIALAHNKVVAHGKNLKEVMAEFKKNYPNIVPYIAKVPSSKHILW